MRVAVLSGLRQVDTVNMGEPELLPGTVVVAIDRCGIGGSDIDAYCAGEVPAPAWFGHEWAGTVAAVGPECPGRFEGERVVGAVPPPCGTCSPCLVGLGQSCETVMAMIIGTHHTASPHGAFAERIRVHTGRVHRVPDGVEQPNAALAEPAAVAAHAVSRGGQNLGDVVAVIGAGTVGLLVAELARLAGAARVVAVDIEPGRRELACSLGADAAFAPGAELLRWLGEQSHGLGADVVYECAGRMEAVNLAVQAARPSGAVVLVGKSAEAGSIASRGLMDKQLTIRASLGYTIADVHRALDLMADDRFRVSAIHERLVGFDELVDAFEDLASNPGARRKVMFSPNP